MLASLLLASSLLVMADPLEGDGIMCSEPSFSLAFDDRQAILSGTITTPQQGYGYRFQVLGANNGVTSVLVSAGQPINYNGYGKSLPAIGQVVVKEKFAIPAGTIQVNVRIEGLARKPSEFVCTMAAPKRKA